MAATIGMAALILSVKDDIPLLVPELTAATIIPVLSGDIKKIQIISSEFFPAPGLSC